MLNVKRIAQLSCLLLALSASALALADTAAPNAPQPQAPANMPGAAMPAPGMAMQGNRMDHLQMLAQKLNLTPQQQQQISQQLANFKPNMERYKSQLRSSHQQLAQMMAQGQFETPDIQKLAAQAGDAMTQLILLHAHSKKVIYDVLTPDQQKQFLAMLQDKANKMQQYSGQHRGGDRDQAPMPMMED